MSRQRTAKHRIIPRRFKKLLMVCILLALSGAALPTWGQSCVPPPADVVSWWPADGNSADYADGNPGVLQNGATFAPGFVGQAFSLDGIDDFVSIPESPNLEIADVITMDAWIKTPGVGVHLQGIVGKMTRANPPRSGYLMSVDQNGKFRCDIIRSIPPQGTAISLTTVADNVFHHVACTYNGTSVNVYVDGNLERSTAYSDGIGLNDEPVRIGYDTADQFLGTRWFKGLIDEVRIFHRALCPSEIKATFQAGSQGQCKDGTSGDASCDDGNACTTGDTCSGGTCVGGPPPNCNDNNVCTDDSCAPAVGCVHVDNTAPCDDGNACTQTDTCQAGACTGSNPVVCTALDQCHVAGTCETSSGICSNPNKTDGSSCSDGNACTQTDTCQAGACTGSNAVVCTALDQCHVSGICDTFTGVCSNPNKADGSSCNDGNACTQTDTCQAGSCIGSNPVVCTALNQCHVAGTCDTSSGVCSNPNKADGSSCNDGNACTQTDTCQAGSCAGSNPVVCTALDQCHNVGTCAPANGTCSNPAKPDGSACNDGSACTISDTCISGGCVGGPPPPEVCNGVDDNCDGAIDEGCVGKITGGGEIGVPGGASNFGFVAQRKAIGDPVTGQLEYMNHARGLNVHSTSILTLFVNGNTATFTGECTKNQTPCTFSVTVMDNAEPGRNVDHFFIAVSGEPGEGAPEPIIRGNIQTHATGSGLTSALQTAADQSPNALAGAGGGTFPAGTLFNGVPLTGLRFGVGVNIPGNGSADGTHETTLLGLSPLGQPQIITLEVAATSGYVTPSGSVYVSGSSSVDMGDGTPPRTGVPFTLATMTDAQGQGVMTLAIDTTSLPVATIDHGRMTPPLCIPPTEVGSTLTLTNTTALSWSSSDAAASYNLYRGTIGGGLRPFDHVCLVPALPGPVATDLANPSAGRVFYYLVSGKNACGEGSLGASSNGQPRPNSSPCP